MINAAVLSEQRLMEVPEYEMFFNVSCQARKQVSVPGHGQRCLFRVLRGGPSSPALSGRFAVSASG